MVRFDHHPSENRLLRWQFWFQFIYFFFLPLLKIKWTVNVKGDVISLEMEMQQLPHSAYTHMWPNFRYCIITRYVLMLIFLREEKNRLTENHDREIWGRDGAVSSILYLGSPRFKFKPGDGQFCLEVFLMPSVPPWKRWESTLPNTGHDRFFPHPFRFINHQWFYH
jgi:hypothetical protein